MQGIRKKLVPIAPGTGKIWDIQHWRYLSQLGVMIFTGVVLIFKEIN
jgi:hypothetical protein